MIHMFFSFHLRYLNVTNQILNRICPFDRKAVGDGKRAILLEPLWPKVRFLFFSSLYMFSKSPKQHFNGLKRLPCRPLLCIFAAQLQKIVNVVSLQGHYRYCEALFFLGEVEMAIYNNSLAMHYCQCNKNSLKDLEQQHLKFHSLLTAYKGIIPLPYKRHVQHLFD